MNTIICKNMTSKDIFNAQSASKTIVDAIDAGLVFRITGVAVVENGATNRKGEPCNVGYIATESDGIFGFVSNVLLKNMEMLADMLDDPEPLNARFISGTTKDGTEFYSIELI